MKTTHSRSHAVRPACWTCSALVVAQVSAIWPAHAGPAAASPALVLESHVGARSPDSGAATGPVLDELERRGFTARPANIAKVLGDSRSQPGILDTDTTAMQLAQRVARGLEAFTTGDFAGAETMLTAAVQQIERNPELAVSTPTLLKTRRKALIGLAQSQVRLGKPDESARTMLEFVRVFPDQPITRREYGPEPERLYREAMRRSRTLGRGRLAIHVDDARAQIFVEGALQGTGTVALAALLAGRYNVFIQSAGGRGRQYHVEVMPGDAIQLDIAWQLDSALTVSDVWVGFVFANEAERAAEASSAAALARRSGSARIAVLDVTAHEGKPTLTGTLIRADGAVIRSASVRPEASDRTPLIALARFIADGTTSPAIRTLIGPVERPVAHPAPSRIASGYFLAAGVAGVLGGAILIAIHQPPGTTDKYHDIIPTRRFTAPFGVAAGVLGLASIGFGVWRMTHPEHAESAPVLSLESTGGTIGWAGRF